MLCPGLKLNLLYFYGKINRYFQFLKTYFTIFLWKNIDIFNFSKNLVQHDTHHGKLKYCWK